jgi:hypothetical protein
MPAHVHVTGQIDYGGMPEFLAAVERYKEYTASHGYVVPRVLSGLSGQMNTVRLVYEFADLAQYAEQELRTLDDKEYGEVAGAMGFTKGSVSYEVFQSI